jgi:hypothetical protein
MKNGKRNEMEKIKKENERNMKGTEAKNKEPARIYRKG